MNINDRTIISIKYGIKIKINIATRNIIQPFRESYGSISSTKNGTIRLDLSTIITFQSSTFAIAHATFSAITTYTTETTFSS